jgi:hypothetical protein
MAVVFVPLAHYKRRTGRDTCNVHVSQMARRRTAAVPSTFRHGKSEGEYQESTVSGIFHIVLSAFRAYCIGEESGTTA